MATTTKKTTTTKKPTTEVIDTEVGYTRPEYIVCKSITSGGLNVTCKSGNIYEFSHYGSECEIEYHDLVALIRKHSEHVFLPRFIITDNEFIQNEFPTVANAYDSMYTDGDLTDILKLSDSQMKKVILELPVNVQNTLRNLAATQIANGKIDSVRKIRALTDVFGSDFNLLSELFI